MHDSTGSSSPDRDALIALALAVAGVGLGVFAFKLHLRGGDEKIFTYTLGLACSGFYMSSLGKLIKALKVRTTATPGSSGPAKVVVVAAAATLVGAVTFTFLSVLAYYLSTFDDLSGVENVVGLIASLLTAFGPLILGAYYFYSMQQSLCEAGWNMAAALLSAFLCASTSTAAWYILNIHFGPLIYLHLAT